MIERQLGWVLLVAALGRIGTTSLSLVSTILLVNGMRPEEYAQYSVAFGFVALLSLLALFGSETTITRDTASAIVSENKLMAKASASANILSSAVFSSLIALIVVFLFPHLHLIPNIPDNIVSICGLWLVAMTMNRLAGEWLRGARHIFAATLFNGLGPFGGMYNSLVMLIALLGLKLTDQMHLKTVLIASTIVYFSSFLIALSIGISSIGLTSTRNGFEHWVKNIRFSFYLYVMQLLQTVSSQQTYILLASWMFDVKTVAFLSVALRLYAMASTVLVTVNQASSELIVRLYTEKNLKGLERLIRLASSATVVAAIGIALAIMGVGPRGFQLIFGPQYSAAYGLSLLFLVSAIINGFGGLADRTMSLLGFVQKAMLVQAYAALATATLTISLGTTLGVYGFVIGCVAAGALQILTANFFAKKYVGVKCYAYVKPREYLSVLENIYNKFKIWNI